MAKIDDSVKKKVPELRFKGFTDDWEERKLGELSNIVGGGTPSTSNSEYWDGDIDWYAPAEIGEQRYVSKSKKTITELGLKKSSARILPVGTVLFTSRAGIGNTAILGKEATTNQGFQSIVPNPNKLDSYFIYSRTNELKRYGEVTGAGSTFVEVSGKQMSKMSIMIPELSEQKKIGSFFEQLDNTIALHQRKLDKLKQLKQGYLQQLFPKPGETVPKIRFANFEGEWEERKLRTLLIKNSKKNKDLTIKNVESISNRTGFTKQTEQFDEYSVASADLSNYYVITEQQFAYNPSRINVGSIAYKPIGDDTSVVSPLYVSFSTKKILNDSFLWNWFKTSSFENQRQRLSEGGVRDTLSFNQLSEMSIVIPQYLEQVKIGNFFKQLDFLITLHQEKLKQLKTCKKALLQKMFI